MTSMLSSGEDRKTRLEAGIRYYRSACGCELASLFMIGATIVFLVYVAHGREEYAVGEALLRGVMWILPVTVGGKLLGLAYARVRLQMLRSALRRETQISTMVRPTGPTRTMAAFTHAPLALWASDESEDSRGSRVQSD